MLNKPYRELTHSSISATNSEMLGIDRYPAFAVRPQDAVQRSEWRCHHDFRNRVLDFTPPEIARDPSDLCDLGIDGVSIESFAHDVLGEARIAQKSAPSQRYLSDATQALEGGAAAAQNLRQRTKVIGKAAASGAYVGK